MNRKPRKTSEERLTELQEKERQIKAQIQREKAKAKQEERKRDTRRKVIIGGMVMAHCQIDPAFEAQIMRLLNQHVTRPADRETLDLPLLTNNETAQNGSTSEETHAHNLNT